MNSGVSKSDELSLFRRPHRKPREALDRVAATQTLSFLFQALRRQNTRPFSSHMAVTMRGDISLLITDDLLAGPILRGVTAGEVARTLRPRKSSQWAFRTVDRISTPSTVPSLRRFQSITWRQLRIHKRSEQSSVCTYSLHCDLLMKLKSLSTFLSSSSSSAHRSFRITSSSSLAVGNLPS